MSAISGLTIDPRDSLTLKQAGKGERADGLQQCKDLEAYQHQSMISLYRAMISNIACEQVGLCLLRIRSLDHGTMLLHLYRCWNRQWQYHPTSP